MTTTENPVRNGVDTATLFATLDAVKASPEIAKFQFRATNRWVSGTHSRSTIHGFYGAGQEMTHRRAVHASTPTTRPCSSAPTTARPRSSSCSTPWPPASPPGIANIAAARGVNLTSVESTVEGDIDLLGILGLSDAGPQRLPAASASASRSRATTPTKLRQVVEQSRRRSAVFDVVTNGVPVSIDVDAG